MSVSDLYGRLREVFEYPDHPLHRHPDKLRHLHRFDDLANLRRAGRRPHDG